MKAPTPVLLLTFCLLLPVGCSSPPTSAVSPDDAAKAKQAKSDLSSKLKAMTPEDRVRYIKAHPGDVNTILRGSGFGAGARPHTPSK